MNLSVLLRLLFAHVLSDFFFQTDKLALGKHTPGPHQYTYLLFHCLTHAATAYLFVAHWTCWALPLIVFVSHAIIDFLKVEFTKPGSLSFLIDQLAHLAVIVLLWLFLFNSDWPSLQDTLLSAFANPDFWVVAIAFALVLKPTSVFLSLFIGRWSPSGGVDMSLPKAGKWIGFFERLLILAFVLTHNAEFIGFLLAAKSIFRFGELSKAQEIKTTEYVLVGTFASFTIAILIAFATLHIIS